MLRKEALEKGRFASTAGARYHDGPGRLGCLRIISRENLRRLSTSYWEPLLSPLQKIEVVEPLKYRAAADKLCVEPCAEELVVLEMVGLRGRLRWCTRRDEVMRLVLRSMSQSRRKLDDRSQSPQQG